MTTNITIIILASLLCFTFLVAYFGYLIMKSEIYKVRRLLRIISRMRKEYLELKKFSDETIEQWGEDLDDRNRKYDELLTKLYEYETAKQDSHEI